MRLFRDMLSTILTAQFKHEYQWLFSFNCVLIKICPPPAKYTIQFYKTLLIPIWNITGRFLDSLSLFSLSLTRELQWLCCIFIPHLDNTFEALLHLFYFASKIKFNFLKCETLSEIKTTVLKYLFVKLTINLSRTNNFCVRV